MTRTQKLLRLLTTALIAALIAGGVTNTLVEASAMEAPWINAYAWALVSALLGAAMTINLAALICALSALTALVALAFGGGAFGVRALVDGLRAFFGSGDWEALASCGGAAAMVLGVALGLLFFALVRRRRRRGVCLCVCAHGADLRRSDGRAGIAVGHGARF